METVPIVNPNSVEASSASTIDEHDEILFASKIPDVVLTGSPIVVALQYQIHTAEFLNNIQIRVSGHRDNNDEEEVPIQVVSAHPLESISIEGQANSFNLPESHILTLSVRIMEATISNQGTVLKFTAQNSQGRFLALLRSNPIRCVEYGLVVEDDFPDNYDIAPGQSASERFFYNAKGGRDKGIKFKISLQDADHNVCPNDDMELKLTLLYEGINQTKVDNQQILQADQKKIQLSNGEAIVKLRIMEVSQKHQGKRFRIKFEGVNVSGEMSDVAPCVSEPIEVRSKINFKNKRNIQFFGAEHSNGIMTPTPKKFKPEQSLSSSKGSIDAIPALQPETVVKIKTRNEKMKANLNILRKYLSQTHEIVAGAQPLIRDPDSAQLAETLCGGYENMTQIMSQLLSDQVAVQNFLEELDANIPRNSESVDDQSDAAARMLISLSNTSAAVPGTNSSMNTYANGSNFQLPSDIFARSHMSPSSPTVLYDNDKQVRMVFLGLITVSSVIKGVPAFKKTADNQWSFVGAYNFVKVEGTTILPEISSPTDIIMELDKSQLISISPTISYLKSYHSAIRAEAVFRINTNPMDNSDVKIEVDFFLIDDRNNKTQHLKKRLQFQPLTIPGPDVAMITEYCSKRSSDNTACFQIESGTQLPVMKKQLAEFFTKGAIPNVFQFDEKKVHFISKLWEFDANQQPISTLAFDKDKKRIGSYHLQKKPVAPHLVTELQHKIFNKLEHDDAFEDELISIHNLFLVEEMGLSGKFRFLLPIDSLDGLQNIVAVPMEFIGFSKSLGSSHQGAQSIKISKFIYSIEFSSSPKGDISPSQVWNVDEVLETNSLRDVKKNFILRLCSTK